MVFVTGVQVLAGVRYILLWKNVQAGLVTHPAFYTLGAFYVGFKWLGFEADHLYQVLYLHPACMSSWHVQG